MTGIGVFMRKVFVPHLFPLGKNIVFPTSTTQLYVSTNPHLYNYITEEKGAVVTLKPCPFSPKTIFALFFFCGYQIMKFPEMK